MKMHVDDNDPLTRNALETLLMDGVYDMTTCVDATEAWCLL